MLIDWFTVSAQAANFLILVWLLRRFAYRPILAAINTREQRIATQLASAAAAQSAALSERETLSRKNAELEQQRSALLDQAIQEAQATRRKLLEQAQQDYGVQRARLLAALDGEQADLRRDLTGKMQAAVLEIAGEVVQQLANRDLNEAMINVFLENLGSLGAGDRELIAAADAAPGTMRICSAFELGLPIRGRIAAAICAIRGREPNVTFETEPALDCGVELCVGGHKFAWSVQDYLAGLRAHIERAVA
ncbi:MAG TPA: hypothetical protein VGV09_04915 [Steroidobacteraceae bacterium]|nr:hypothetical protein [Steroidobacteraceae bacterium]